MLLHMDVTEKTGCGFSAWRTTSQANFGFENQQNIEVHKHVRGQDEVHDILADLLGGDCWHVREQAHVASNVKGRAYAEVLDGALPVVGQRRFGANLCLVPKTETGGG